jgi:pantetheine-phosphate adenylyltransferase
MAELKKVAVGGTFDELHKGHKVLLMKAFEIGERVIIGLCSDAFVKRLVKPHITASYEERLKELNKFLSNLRLSGRAEIISLNEPFGSSATDGSIDGLVVSEETLATANKINDQRRKSRLPALKILTVSMVRSDNCGPISTTRIRRGEMDREGRLLKAPSGFFHENSNKKPKMQKRTNST